MFLIFPVQGSFLKDIPKPKQQKTEEQQHLPETIPPEFLEVDGPGIKEDDEMREKALEVMRFMDM